MVRLQIVLQSNSAAFLAGEQVNGNVIAQVDQPTKARKVCVEVFGHAHNHWTESHYRTDSNGHGHTDYEDYSAEVQFINVILLLWRPQGAGEGILQPGNYCFPFSFVVPPNALPNHHGRYGVIDYFCKAKVDRPWRVDDEVRFPFLVANIVDLNVVPGAPNAVRAVISKPLGFCGGGGFLAAEASLAKFGYSSGEQMLLTIDFKNDSSESVTNIYVRAHEQWLYRANHCGCQDTRTFTRDLLSFNERFDVSPGQQQRYQRHIKLPALQPTYSCPITVHDFAVSVRVTTSGMCSSSLSGDIPFFVGTVPYGTAQAATPTGNVTVLTQEARNEAIQTVAMDQAVDTSCC